ncbi:hypothetical protein D9M69_573570 [compost metagenome]
MDDRAHVALISEAHFDGVPVQATRLPIGSVNHLLGRDIDGNAQLQQHTHPGRQGLRRRRRRLGLQRCHWRHLAQQDAVGALGIEWHLPPPPQAKHLDLTGLQREDTRVEQDIGGRGKDVLAVRLRPGHHVHMGGDPLVALVGDGDGLADLVVGQGHHHGHDRQTAGLCAQCAQHRSHRDHPARQASHGLSCR